MIKYIEKVFEEVRDWALQVVKAGKPYKTGALKRSFKLVIYPDGWGIQTDIPYMKDTEEAWTFNRRWGKTLRNPNEGWFRERAIIIAEEMTRRLGGVLNVR